MHLHFESNVNTKCDCTILSLSWMGKVPDDIPEDEGWKLNRTNYYQEGWLATGNIRGIVGVTFTTSHCRKNMDYPLRTNYNLRGHRSDVILVKWNEPYQKLASCDSSGIIFVWIKYEGRWSIELINDRNTPVTHFSWSHDGRMALICYQDGFVLVGSVAGQRYWSSMLNLESTITCGIWTPDDQQVYFGTTQGQIIVMDVHGAMVSQVQLCNDVGITAMAWSCEKFKMEEGEESEPGVANAAKRSFVLAVSFQNGFIYLLKSFDDVSPAHINTGLNGSLGLVMEWSNSRELLAVAGTTMQSGSRNIDSQNSQACDNVLKFYTESGVLLFQTRIPNSNSAVSALTWGHNDKRLFIATGTQVHIAWVSRRVATLQLLCRLRIQSSIGSENRLHFLPLPSRIKSLIGYLFAQTIRCCVPDVKSLREFVSRPPMCSTRLHCTMIRHDDDSNLSSGTCYTLYLEYLGGLVPLLKGKRTSKIRPEFVIFDPQVNDSSTSIFFPNTLDAKSLSASSQSTATTGNGARTDSSDSDFDENGRGSPRTLRKRTPRQKKPNQTSAERTTNNVTANDPDSLDELAYVDTLPEEVKLVEVTSNIWGTKFKIHGLAKTVPANLGQVTYKTSLLHLQPRQMTLVITELRDDFPSGPDPNFNPNIFSEDEEDPSLINNVAHHSQNISALTTTSIGAAAAATMTPSESLAAKMHAQCQRRLNETAPPIAPMSPFLTARLSAAQQRQRNVSNFITPLARAESYDDDSCNESTDKLSQETNSAASCSNNNSINNNNSHSSSKLSRPKTITACTPGFRSNYGSRSSSNSSCQSRHAISPLYCDGSVPTLQSPKSAVAPSDIIFERPAVTATGQTTLMSYSSNADYTNNVVQVKNALLSDSIRATNSHVNPVPLNLSLNLERMDTKIKTPSSLPKRYDIKFIDEETQSPTQQQQQQATPSTTVAVAEICMKRTPTCVSIAPALPANMPRSCSVGYLDSVAVTPSDEALNALRREAPNKRLILVNNRKQRKKRQNDDMRIKPRLQQTGKSKSFDSCMLLVSQKYTTPKPQEINEKMLQKLNEISESNSAETMLCQQCRKNVERKQETCKRCLLATKQHIVENLKKEQQALNKLRLLHNLAKEQKPTLQTPKKSADVTSSNIKKRFDVVTSFTDSPLFTRKHRFGVGRNKQSAPNSGTSTENSTPILGRKNEHGFNLVKQLAEVRWRRKETTNNEQQNVNVAKEEITSGYSMNLNSNTVEATPVEAKTSVSLHTQALTTLENIISRLRDLDEGRFTPPASPHRLPRSSPASPAVSKKSKRQQNNSPIRHILNSPLLNRRQRKKQQSMLESSDDEGNHTNSASGEERDAANDMLHNKQYRDLETFQKAQLRQKLKRGKIEPNGTSNNTSSGPLRREFVMHNKAPMWNEMSQVYQLDFGGRVTQESAKNFQIEFRGKQVMQFGRIDGNAYTLDFQYPFSALQAFAVALANVTQRLK